MSEEARMGEREHELKVWPEFFDALADGSKPFEVRRDDRGFLVGDRLRLREWVPSAGSFTGREVERVVSFVLSSDQSPERGAIGSDFVVLGLTFPEPSDSRSTTGNTAGFPVESCFNDKRVGGVGSTPTHGTEGVNFDAA